MNGYRPIKLKNWTKATLDEVIEAVEQSLYKFMETSAYDSGYRKANTESYLQGLLDARRLTKKSPSPSRRFERE